mgnify:CR=1 FL=1
MIFLVNLLKGCVAHIRTLNTIWTKIDPIIDTDLSTILNSLVKFIQLFFLYICYDL